MGRTIFLFLKKPRKKVRKRGCCQSFFKNGPSNQVVIKCLLLVKEHVKLLSSAKLLDDSSCGNLSKLNNEIVEH